MLNVKHHDLIVKINPQQGTINCLDTITFDTLKERIEIHLGKRFSFTKIHQSGKLIQHKELEEGKITKKYALEDLDAKQNTITFEWTGKVDTFEGYRVSIVRSDLVELSGFCNWFPTVEHSSQSENFTYKLKINLPGQWKIYVPGVSILSEDKKYRMFEFVDEKIQDILICASPDFKEYTKGKAIYVMPKWPKEEIDALLEDFESIIRICEDLFGEMIPGTGGVAIISPRIDGEEWGYERGQLWIIGDKYAQYWLQNDKVLRGLTKSIAAHESIHAWFGNGVGFEEDWLVEAITQYLEVFLTSVMYEENDLPDRYFKWYQERVLEKIKNIDKAIVDFEITDDHYIHWYLKGSWAFWDLEYKHGRTQIFDFLAFAFNKYKNNSINYKTFSQEANEFFNDDVESFLDYWFYQIGFKPLARPIYEE